MFSNSAQSLCEHEAYNKNLIHLGGPTHARSRYNIQGGKTNILFSRCEKKKKVRLNTNHSTKMKLT